MSARGPAVVRGGDAVDRVERPALALPQLAGRRGGPGALLAGPRLQAVGERRLVQEPRRAQPGEEVLGGAVEQRAAKQRDEPARRAACARRPRAARARSARPRRRTRGAGTARQPPRRARRSRSPPARRRPPGSAARPRAATSSSSARSPPPSISVIAPSGSRRGGVEQRAVLRRLEQPPLEVVQRGRGVVVGDRRELDDAVGDRAQRLDGLACGRRTRSGRPRTSARR